MNFLACLNVQIAGACDRAGTKKLFLSRMEVQSRSHDSPVE
jgi:hypothetical protein